MSLRKRQTHDDVQKTLSVIVTTLEDRKAQNLAVLDLTGRSTFMDYMVIASGTSSRHVAAMAELLHQALRPMSPYLRVEGLAQADWVLIDTGDIIIHLFRGEELRGFYALEKLWS